MKHLIHCTVALFAGFLLASTAAGQAKPLAGADVSKIYERLLKQIDQIPIYDNHSHATFPDDSDMDAMTGPPDESSVLRLRDTNPEFAVGAKALYRGGGAPSFRP